jgi:hypothetical protein
MGLRVDERIVAGDDGDGLVVHHLVLRGSTASIARHLGELTRARYGVGAASDATPLPGRLRCSAAFTPPRRAPSGHPLVARSFELAGALGRPRPGEPPPASRPYVVELHPDEGYASLAVCAFALQGAALDGVNAEGLVAVAALDLASTCRVAALQLVRGLLDRCATAAEARDALAAAGAEALAASARWLVADRHGDAFVIEASAGGTALRSVEVSSATLGVAGDAADGAAASLRRLWLGEYDAVERRLSARFFVGDGGVSARPPPEVRFQLA